MLDKFLRDSHHFRQIVDKKLNEMGRTHAEFLQTNFKDSRKLEKFIQIIDEADREKLENPSEKAFYDGFHTVKEMMKEFTRFQANFNAEYLAEFKKLSMPVFVERHPLLRQKWIERWEEIIVPSFEISESVFVPRAPVVDTSLIDDKLTEKDRELLQENKNVIFDKQGVAVQLSDFDSGKKNEERVQRSAIMGEILNKIATDIEDGKQLDEIPKELLQEGQTYRQKGPKFLKTVDGKFHPNELARALYLNNSDPEKYNLDFFAEYFVIERPSMKKVFDFASYPLLDSKKERVVKILRFVNSD